MTTEAVLAEREGGLGHVRLNRPSTINALTLEMVLLIDAALHRFEHDERVRCVLFDGAGERGFCAGGDVVALHDAAKAGDFALPRSFWRAEYQLNARIARYPKPLVAIMDGIVMGGGVGLSAHARHRVATERLILAMPEVGIGFAPDVGGTYLLSRAPGELGTYLALTGERIGANDALLCGLVDRVVSSRAIAPLVAWLRDGDVEAALAAAPEPTDLRSGVLALARGWVNAACSANAVTGIVAQLRARPEPAAHAAARAIASKSPTSLKVTLRALRQARGLPSLEACLNQEYRTSLAFLTAADFVEGIRAALVDKDRTPRWDPPTLERVDPAIVDRFFVAPEGTGELELAA